MICDRINAGIFIVQQVFVFSFGDHIAQPLFAQRVVEIQSHRPQQDIIQPLSGILPVRYDVGEDPPAAMKPASDMTQRHICLVKPQCILIIHPAGSVPADDFFDEFCPQRSLKIITAGQHFAVMGSPERLPPNPSDKPSDKRYEPEDGKQQRRHRAVLQLLPGIGR